MKTLILAAVLAFVAAESNYFVLEKLDIDKVVTDIDELQKYTNCLLEKIPCNKVHESYRDWDINESKTRKKNTQFDIFAIAFTVNAVEAIQQSCERCTPLMKNMFWRYLQTLKTKLPNKYIEFKQKYDPENKYFDALEAELNKYSHL